MAAYAAVATLINLIHDIQHHHSPPVSFPIQHLQSLTQILTSLLDFLETYKSPVADADESDRLEMRIADAAYAAQDLIESSILDKIRRTASTPENEGDDQVKSSDFYPDLERVIEEMDVVKQMAMKIDTKNVAEAHGEDVSASAAPLKPSSSATTSSAMVCSDAVLLGVIEKLIGVPLDRQVIPIAGMGGIGKTTLASIIYAHSLVKEHFDICAWATISQKYNTREILRDVVSQATNRDKDEVNDKSEDELGLELHQYLFGRRFLIVMDDMWSIDAWDKMQCYFPNNGNGSRILVTTRLSELGSQLNATYSHQMEFLNEVSGWNLFCRTVFGERSSCPRELEGIGKSIVNHCRGLPLSIVVVGGILKRMEQTERCWESIRNNLTSLVNLENDKHCLRLLKLSYNHLPAYLKPCFLFMGMFEEDAEIDVSTLIRLWVSEGFLKPMDDRSTETINAMGFLKSLIDRNLVQIHRLSDIGDMQSCKIHDLLRDLCLKEGERDGFHHAIGKYSKVTNRQCRRISITRDTSMEKVVEDMKSIRHARSVICDYGEVPLCPNFGLLTTFHVHEVRDFNKPPCENPVEFQCFNLRHLDVHVDSMSWLFSSLNLFWNLHTLIVWYLDECTAPAEIWKMPQFRHIEFAHRGLCLPDPPNDKDGDDVVIMKNLETLYGVKNFMFCEEVVKRIPNIKNLSVKYDRLLEGANHVDSYFVANIESLCKLESLTIYIHDDKLTGHPCLHKLSFPRSVRSLNLRMNDAFEWEAVLENINSLPCLEKFVLDGGSFRTGKWEIVEGQFPKLKFLGLNYVKHLKQWTVEESSVLPHLAHLNLSSLYELEEFPREIGHIPTLEKITLYWCNDSLVKSAKAMVEEQVEFQGEQLSFHVNVQLRHNQKSLKSLEDQNFRVHHYFWG